MSIRTGSLETYALPLIGGGREAIRIATASGVPIRVLVRVEPILLVGLEVAAAILSLDPNSLNQLPANRLPSAGSLYRISQGNADVVVLSPTQQLYAMGVNTTLTGTTVILSIAVSDAYPVSTR